MYMTENAPESSLKNFFIHQEMTNKGQSHFNDTVMFMSHTLYIIYQRSKYIVNIFPWSLFSQDTSLTWQSVVKIMAFGLKHCVLRFSNQDARYPV